METFALFLTLTQYIWRSADVGAPAVREAFSSGLLACNIRQSKLGAEVGRERNWVTLRINEMEKLGWVKKRRPHDGTSDVIYILGTWIPDGDRRVETLFFDQWLLKEMSEERPQEFPREKAAIAAIVADLKASENIDFGPPPCTPTRAGGACANGQGVPAGAGTRMILRENLSKIELSQAQAQRERDPIEARDPALTPEPPPSNPAPIASLAAVAAAAAGHAGERLAAKAARRAARTSPATESLAASTQKAVRNAGKRRKGLDTRRERAVALSAPTEDGIDVLAHWRAAWDEPMVKAGYASQHTPPISDLEHYRELLSVFGGQEVALVLPMIVDHWSSLSAFLRHGPSPELSLVTRFASQWFNQARALNKTRGSVVAGGGLTVHKVSSFTRG